jgi:hypothetical protein
MELKNLIQIVANSLKNLELKNDKNKNLEKSQESNVNTNTN